MNYFKGMDIDIGDFIEYECEYYNGGINRYERFYRIGCVIEKDKDCVNVIKQFGGQIWCGVIPIIKVSDDVF